MNRIYYLGPSGSYTSLALEKFCEEYRLFDYEVIALNTIQAVLKEFDRDTSSYCVVPFENMIEGIVTQTCDGLNRLSDSDAKVVGQCVLPIEHCLISKGKSIEFILSIRSHFQAISQCQNSLNEIFDFNKVKLELESKSTSECVMSLVGEDMTVASIGSRSLAMKLGLNILKSSISDEPCNKTRFFLLGRKDINKYREKSITLLSFVTKNEVGALYRVLDVFNRSGINLRHISSRPSKKDLGEYVFFVEFEGNIMDEKMTMVIDRLKLLTIEMRIFGSYNI